MQILSFLALTIQSLLQYKFLSDGIRSYQIIVEGFQLIIHVWKMKIKLPNALIACYTAQFH
ncbi:hypothetical protein T4B_5983 [Trichinella pseudospiralis]|uniref:Uncharacterized protein n=1 Tax=Trichinella pseudospiralis TaxID=6337 RepID=A0A0V1IT77_TRIPS|nr:hypothetical protein T4B_5983 [Trichinella pseudospiralis]